MEEEHFPPQHQEEHPGKEHLMRPEPASLNIGYIPAGKLAGKVAAITGGDSGIGKSVAITFAREGADIAIIYLNEHEDAEATQKIIQDLGRKCMLIDGDISDESFCRTSIGMVASRFKKIDILVNNAAVQYHAKSITDISAQQLEKTFAVNVFAMFHLTKAALKCMKKGSVIINTSSVTAYRGSHHLIDYAASKGAIIGFTRSLSKSLIEKGIRVNAVAPGPIWTPLIPSSFPKDHIPSFGSDVPMGRAGQPEEVAGCYVFLASEDSAYMTGQVLHPNGGEIIGG